MPIRYEKTALLREPDGRLVQGNFTKMPLAYFSEFNISIRHGKGRTIYWNGSDTRGEPVETKDHYKNYRGFGDDGFAVLPDGLFAGGGGRP